MINITIPAKRGRTCFFHSIYLKTELQPFISKKQTHNIKLKFEKDGKYKRGVSCNRDTNERIKPLPFVKKGLDLFLKTKLCFDTTVFCPSFCRSIVRYRLFFTTSKCLDT